MFKRKTDNRRIQKEIEIIKKNYFLISLLEKETQSNENSNKPSKFNKIRKLKPNMKDNNKIGKRYTVKNFVIIGINLLILFNIFKTSLPNNKLCMLESYFGNITLKVKGIGYSNIFGVISGSFSTSNYPELIYINGEPQSPITYNYNMPYKINYVELIWSNTISDCQNMFRDCSNITEIDIHNFDTSNVERMDDMFNGCSSLTSINLNNFITSSVTSLGGMFRGCKSLTSINLSSFDTSSVKYINHMFAGCSSLTSLNLSNFYIPNLERIFNFFSDCVNLEYVNMENFNGATLQSNWCADIFQNVPNNLVICLDLNNSNNNKIKQRLSNVKYYINYCYDDWKSKQKKIIDNEEGSAVDNCENHDQYKYEYNGKCYKNCSNGVIINDNNAETNKCKCELDKCLYCPPVPLSLGLCTQCNQDYYQIENDPLNLGEYINCYKDPKGYYLDQNDVLYKKCFDRCETCEIKGDNISHNCLSCNDNYPFEIKLFNNSYNNCYENCSYYYYFDNETNYHCTINYSCPEEYPLLIEDKMECINEDSDLFTTYIEHNIQISSEEIKETYFTSISKSESIMIKTSDIFNFEDNKVSSNINNDIEITIAKTFIETKNIVTQNADENHHIIDIIKNMIDMEKEKTTG